MSNDKYMRLCEPSEDLIGDPVFYKEETNEIAVLGQFTILLPEKYGWVEIGEL